MSDAKTDSRLLVCAALNQFKQEKQLPGDEIKAESIPLETPPNPEMGDIGMPMFIPDQTGMGDIIIDTNGKTVFWLWLLQLFIDRRDHARSKFFRG